MRAFIHTVNGRPFNEDCTTAKRGFEKLGVECVPFSTNEELEAAAHEDIVVAGMLVTEHALAIRGVEPPNINYPEELKRFLGRKVWQCRVGDIKEANLPIFIKPAAEKEIQACLAETMEDLLPFRAKGDNYQVFCSEPVEFISEWRIFQRYGEFAGAKPYIGGTGSFPNVDVVNEIMKSYSNQPAGCAVDIGTTSDGRSLLVKVNDGFSLGSYGADSVEYALLLSARWAELVGSEDPFKDLDSRGWKKTPEREQYFDRDKLELLLTEVVNSTGFFISTAIRCADYGGVANELIAYLDGYTTSVKMVWEWLIKKLGLYSFEGPGGIEYVVAQIPRRCYVIDVSTGKSHASGWLNLYNEESAVITVYAEDRESTEAIAWFESLLAEFLEKEALLDLNLRSVFALGTEGDVEDNAFWEARGYKRVPKKDEEDLARAMGAWVVHDFLLEKMLP